MAKLQPWTLNKPECLLISDETTINLAPTKYIVLDLLASGTECTASNKEILIRLNKDLATIKDCACASAGYKQSSRKLPRVITSFGQ